MFSFAMGLVFSAITWFKKRNFAPQYARMNQSILKISLLTVISLLISTVSVLAQDGSIKGFVKSKSTTEAVMFASVTLEGTTYGINTDVNGYYSLTQIPPGTYNLVVSSLEYSEKKVSVEVKSGKIATVNFLLETRVVEIGSAEISADQAEQETTVKMSVETIRPADIRKIPSIGGQADLVQALQVLPGFVSTGDQGGQLYIRGGSPVQNKVLLDGMIVYNPFHSIGLFSVFDADIISNADVYTGGFGAEFGGRISSIMDIKTRDGNKARVSGKVGASPFGAKVMVEGPLKKLTEKSGGISYVFSAKRSYLEQTSKSIYEYVAEDGLPFNFTDFYGKVSFGGKSGSKLNVFGFSFNDDVKYLALSNLNWKNYGAGANFVVVPSGSSMLINGYFSSSTYEITLEEEGLADRFSEVGGFNMGLDFKLVKGDDELKYGINVVGVSTNFETFNPLGITIKQEENTTELGAYLSYKITAAEGDLILDPSMRLQYYSSLGQFSPEPRLGVKYKVSPRFRLKGAAGMYSQNLIAANSDRDVVNLFYGFLNGPQNLPSEFILPSGEVKEVTNGLQKANHLILGFEYDLTEKININIEGYRKNFTQLTNTNRNKLFADDPDLDVPDNLKKDFIVETGYAQGVDFVLKYEEKYTYVWLVYSLGLF
ncbi:MAG: TonB-dependent receptor [Flavobacteriales bacterium]